MSDEKMIKGDKRIDGRKLDELKQKTESLKIQNVFKIHQASHK